MRNGHVGLQARINHSSIDLPNPFHPPILGLPLSLIEKHGNIIVINLGLDLWPDRQRRTEVVKASGVLLDSTTDINKLKCDEVGVK